MQRVLDTTSWGNFVSVQSTTKFWLLERGLAGTEHIATLCEANHGSYTLGTKTYRLPTETEFAEALIYALELEYAATHESVESPYSYLTQQ